jgi:hypothetical protein
MKHILVILSLIVISACGSPKKDSSQNVPLGTTLFSVVSSPTSYMVDGYDNPGISLQRGVTYTFNVIAIGHPFFIMSKPSQDPHDAYPHGVINQGVENGTMYFTVPVNAPNVLYYNSSAASDAALAGVIQIID